MSTFVNNNIIRFNGTNTTSNSTNNIYTNNTGAAVKISSISFVYTATATVGNRIVTIESVDSSGNVIWFAFPTVVETAGTATQIIAAPGLFPLNQSGILQISLPTDSYLLPGGSIKIFDKAAIDVTDTITVIWFTSVS